MANNTFNLFNYLINFVYCLFVLSVRS